MVHQHVATADGAETSGPALVDRDAIKALIGSALGYAMTRPQSRAEIR